MATIETRQTPDGKTADLRENSHSRPMVFLKIPSQSATFERKTDARQWAQKTETAMREGRI